MALWMEAGADPVTDSEKADLDALAALNLSSALELKEEGNEFVKKGKEHYAKAIHCYTRAIQLNSLSDSHTSVLLSNRAQVNLLLGNYRRALTDADESIKLCSSNVKAYYRAAKAASSLNLLAEAVAFCEKGLELFPSNEELKKLFAQVDTRKREYDLKMAKFLPAVSGAKEVVSAIEKRGLRFGRAMYQELTGLKKPMVDGNGVVHWPVLLLYAESMSTDFIEDFLETDIFSSHLDIMYSENSEALPWDKDHAYTRDSVELYYQADVGSPLSKREIMKYLLEGTVDSRAIDDFLTDDNNNDGDDNDTQDRVVSPPSNDNACWVKVNEKNTLLQVLQQRQYIIPAIPVFYVVSKKSSFYKEFRAGRWCPP